MKAAIAIDRWKLKIFERNLRQDDFKWEKLPGVTKGTLILSVETEDALKLGATVQRANDEAARAKKL